ncbi:CACTA en-spm transposon protein [Cucumis melo var. makuwa]|uniref:CACTA en-spm transposon protein n=1 Tax=Cucumis melo var. makuwa TaxID=1194695 RepID=A0A5D3DKB3_CUCMM|nr:CACTA en-spm transposon protein [Cucumis melo var. makuwa]
MDKRTDDVLRHPADAEGMWHVVLLPYNLPPWKCMKETNFFMSLLIPGPRSPGRKIDVYLQPLIEKLKELWTFGVHTYDSLTGKNKDTMNVRLNLQDLKIRKDLHLIEVCNRLVKPYASYTLTSSERVEFCKFLKSVGKNISTCSFIVMVHLAVHLPYATKVTGPISYSWMYLIERSLCTLKKYVRNKARPEGSIAEAYVMNESSTFCSCYLSGIETRFTRDERNDDTNVEDEVLKLRESVNLSDNFFSLAMGPSFDVHCYNRCIMGGLRFHTSELDSRRTTQNSELMVISENDASGNDDNNLYGLTLIPQSLKDRLCVMSLTTSSTMWMNTCHMQATTTNYSDKPRIMSSYPQNNILETNNMFLEFENDLDNLAGGSSLVGDNSGSSTQPPATPTPRRRVQSRLLELERYVVVNECILMTIAHGAEKHISPHVIRFSQAISVCVRKIFPVSCLKWVDVGREYIEVIKGNLQRFFVLDFNDQENNRFVEHQTLNTFKGFRADCHRHFKMYSDPKEARTNPPNILVGRDED